MKNSKNWVWYITMVLKKKPTFDLDSLLVLHENCRFFDVSRITGTGDSLSLIFPKN